MTMASCPYLTPGAVPALHNGSSIPEPTLQIIDIKQMPNQQSYRVVLSDGQYYMAGVLATQLIHMVQDGLVGNNNIIKLLRYQPQEVNGRRLIIIYDLAKVPGVADVIGKPQKYGDPVQQPNPTPTPAPSATDAYGAGGYSTSAVPAYGSSNQASHSSGAGSAGYGGASTYGAPAASAGRPTSNYGGSANPSPYGSAGPYGSEQKPYGSAPQPQQQQYQGYGGGARGGPVVPTRTGRSNIVSIADLNPYMTNWQIKARVTSKGEMKTWSNAKGEGNLFSFEVLDAAGGEIRLTAFKQDADRFFDLIQVGNVYLISGGTLKVANRAFTHLKHEYEITLGRETQIEPVQGEDNSISKMHYDFVSIGQIENIAPNAFVDVIGIVTEVSPLGTIISKTTQREIQKRTCNLIDDSNKAIEITIWGKAAQDFDENRLGGNVIVAFKGLRVSEFSGRSLSTVNSSAIVVQPDIPHAHRLHQWFSSSNGAVNVDSLSKRGGAGSIAGLPYKTCSEIVLDGNIQDQTFFLISATINVLQFNNDRPPWYLACPGPDCKKKVTDNGAGGFTCEKCNRTYPTCIPRYIFSFAVSDATGSAWLSAFSEIGEQVLGNRTAEDIRNCVENGDFSAAESVFRDANFSEYLFKVRAKFDSFNDSSRLRCTVMNVLPIDHAAECARLCEMIRQY